MCTAGRHSSRRALLNFIILSKCSRLYLLGKKCGGSQSISAKITAQRILEDGNFAEALLLGAGLLAGSNVQHQLVQVSTGFIQRLFAVSNNTGVKIDPSEFFGSSWLLVAIFEGGSGAPNGVPRPVLNKIMWAPAAVRAVAETRSLPGPYSMFRPLVVTASP